MELLAIALIGGAALAIVLFWIIYRAVGNALDWLIYTFGNERAAAQIEEKWRRGEPR